MGLSISEAASEKQRLEQTKNKDKVSNRKQRSAQGDSSWQESNLSVQMEGTINALAAQIKSKDSARNIPQTDELQKSKPDQIYGTGHFKHYAKDMSQIAQQKIKLNPVVAADSPISKSNQHRNSSSKQNQSKTYLKLQVKQLRIDKQSEVKQLSQRHNSNVDYAYDNKDSQGYHKIRILGSTNHIQNSLDYRQYDIIKRKNTLDLKHSQKKSLDNAQELDKQLQIQINNLQNSLGWGITPQESSLSKKLRPCSSLAFKVTMANQRGNIFEQPKKHHNRRQFIKEVISGSQINPFGNFKLSTICSQPTEDAISAN